MVACLPAFAMAEGPVVVADIAPVHSLVAQIMDGVGEPALLLPASASPHDYALRPSDAAALQSADAVFWVGSDLTPWLEPTLEALSRDAVTVSLLNVEQTLTLDFREGAVFAAKSDDHDHDHDHADEHDHDHSGTDPHAWLDPVNARVWVGAIAAELSELDPENAETYQRNLETAQQDIDLLTAQLQSDLASLNSIRFVVLHDGYRYFEDRFGLSAAGAISESDATSPSAGRVRDIRRAIEEQDVTCLFTEVQLQSSLVDVLASETEVEVLTLDPLGALLEPGKTLYGEKMRNIAASFEACQASMR